MNHDREIRPVSAYTPLDARFPQRGDLDAIAAWQPSVAVRALHSQVLVIAVSRVEGAWAAYLGPVAGHNHEVEWREVWRHGNKQAPALANHLFPGWAEIPYAR